MNALGLGVECSDLRRLEDAFRLAPEMAQREMRGFITETTADLQSEVVRYTPKTHGTLRQSIIGNVTSLAGGIGVQGVVGSPLSYVQAVELGTRPHMPPVEPLIDWVRQKFGLNGKEAISAAWRVARGIARHGTPAAGMFHFAWRDNKSQVAEKFAATVRRIASQIGAAS
jgi:hypothetical protein